MADQFQLRLATPRRDLVEQPVVEVTAPGAAGEFGVLPDHVNFLTSLACGRLSFKDPRGTATAYAIRAGFAEVSDNVMIVLADAAETPVEIDAAAARADLAEAEAALEKIGPVDSGYEAAESRRAWARARLEVSGAK